MVAVEADGAAARFNMGRVAARTFDVIGRNFVPFTLLATISVAPPVLLSIGVTRNQAMSAGPTLLPTMTAALLAILAAILGLIMALFLQAALVQGTFTTLNGKPASLNECLSTALRRLPRLIGLGILSGLGYALGFILLVVPGFILVTMWAVVAPVCVVEDRGIGDCFSRSAELTRNHRWAIFGLFFVFGLACVIASLVVFSLVGSGRLGASPHLQTNMIYWLANTVLQIVTNLIGAVGIASVYFELRTIKEGVGPEQLASVFA
jgi:hypothetical protein